MLVAGKGPDKDLGSSAAVDLVVTQARPTGSKNVQETGVNAGGQFFLGLLRACYWADLFFFSLLFLLSELDANK